MTEFLLYDIVKSFILHHRPGWVTAVSPLLLVLPIFAVLFALHALPRLREDIPAALYYSTNWVYIVREVPYFEAFGRAPLFSGFS